MTVFTPIGMKDKYLFVERVIKNFQLGAALFEIQLASGYHVEHSKAQSPSFASRLDIEVQGRAYRRRCCVDQQLMSREI